MTYALPTSTSWVTASWQDHRNRTPPSSEPGTDYGSPYGSPVYAVADGTVTYVKTTNSGAMGRVVEYVLDDGRTTRTLHLSVVYAVVGQRIGRGWTIGLSGASGNGSDWYYGPHAHQTLWPGAAWAAPTIDFQLYTQEEDMPLTKADIDAIVAAVFNTLVTKQPNGSDTTLGNFMTQTWTLGNMIYDDTPGRVADALTFPALDYDALVRALTEAGITVVVVKPDEPDEAPPRDGSG